MLRILFWLLIVFVVWKIVNGRTPRKQNKNTTSSSSSTPPAPANQFRDIEDAKYEDITSKPTPPKQ